MIREGSSMDDSLLTVKNLSAWYDRERKVLSDFSLELLEHEAVGLIGLNGAGKTTFLKVLSGLLSGFDAEGIWFQGRPVRMREQSFKLCRYTVFDEDHSFQYFTFREYLTYVSHAYGEKLSGVGELVKGFGFERYEDVLLKELSTGNRKKVFPHHCICTEAEAAFTGRTGEWAGFSEYRVPVPADFRVSGIWDSAVFLPCAGKYCTDCRPGDGAGKRADPAKL